MACSRDEADCHQRMRFGRLLIHLTLNWQRGIPFPSSFASPICNCPSPLGLHDISGSQWLPARHGFCSWLGSKCRSAPGHYRRSTSYRTTTWYSCAGNTRTPPALLPSGIIQLPIWGSRPRSVQAVIRKRETVPNNYPDRYSVMVVESPCTYRMQL